MNRNGGFSERDFLIIIVVVFILSAIAIPQIAKYRESKEVAKENSYNVYDSGNNNIVRKVD
ncbi:hypothetical protein C0584_03715 [Candidatus Parcubacteria bacterium]|nr:MAG: hypothetical protein C0584_03715 [Candidatus Parcubacteria bacterium]